MGRFYEIIIMQELMANTLNKFAEHYIKNETMSKDKFFEIQIKVLNKIKKKHKIKGLLELDNFTKKTSKKVENERKE